MSRRRRSLEDIESALGALELDASRFERLARALDLTLEPPATHGEAPSDRDASCATAVAEPPAPVYPDVDDAPPPAPPTPEPEIAAPQPRVAAPAPEIKTTEPRIAVPEPDVKQAEASRDWTLPTLLAAAGLAAVLLWRGSGPSARPIEVAEHRSFPLYFGRLSLLAVNGARIETLEADHGFLLDLDATDFKPRAIHRLLPGEDGGLAWGGEALWSAVPEKGAVLRREPRARFAVQERLADPQLRPGAIAVEGDTLWLFDRASESVRRYGLGASLRPEGSYSLSAVDPVGLHAAAGTLWLADRSTRRLLRYRAAKDLRLTGWIDLDPWLEAGSVLTGFSVERGTAWVLTDRPSRLHQFRAAQLR